MSYPLVTVVLINYNGRNLLQRFLPSLANLNYLNYEVVVVDNASSDGSAEFLKNTYPQFQIISTDKNYGTAQGSNIGAKEAKGEYIFFISNDMELDQDILRHMIYRMQSDPKIGICSCKMRRITEDGKRLNIIDSVGGDLDIFGFPSARGINQIDNGQLDYFSEVFFSFGGALLIKKEIFQRTSGYDAKYFTLGDDIEICWRVRLLGYKVVVEPKAYLYHRVSATLGAIYGRSHRRFLSEKNTLRTLLKNYSLLTLFLILPLYFSLLCAEIIFFFTIGKFPLALADIKAVKQTLEELPDIIKRRKEIQRQRNLSDFALFKLMKIKSHKIELFLDFIKNRGRGPSWDNYFGE